MNVRTRSHLADTEFDIPATEWEGQARTDVPTNSFIRLPPDLATRFRLIRELPNQGSQSDIVLVRRQETQAECVIKLYRRGTFPKMDVLQAVANFPSDNLVKIIEFGTCGTEANQYPYEVLEYIPEGSLRDLLKQGAMSHDQSVMLLQQMTGALDHLHSLKIFHRDVKPENVLLKARQPLNLVLSDYGVSSMSDGTVWQTRFAGTGAYIAPEILGAGEQLARAASDYWALGMVMVEALTGAHPFSGVARGTINSHLALAKPIDLSDVPVDWQLLCRGLLIRDPNNRWGSQQVMRWLAGEREDIELLEDVITVQQGGAYRFDGKEYETHTNLVGAFAANWVKGIAEIRQGHLTDWLRKSSQYEAATFVEELRSDTALNDDTRLFLIIAHFCPKLPLVWKGQLIDEKNLLVLAARQDEASRTVLSDVFDRKLLDHPGLAETNRMQRVADSWRKAVQENNELWAIEPLRALATTARPDRRNELCAALLVACDSTTRGTLQRLLQDAVKNTAARKCEWYVQQVNQMGKLGGILHALHGLQGQAVDQGNAVIAEEARLAKAAVDAHLWGKRRRRIVLNASIFGLGLGSVMGAIRYWMVSSKPYYWTPWNFSIGFDKNLGWDALGLTMVYLVVFGVIFTMFLCWYTYYIQFREKFLE